MKEIDFLPSCLRRTTGHRRWRFGTIIAAVVLIVILGGLRALRPVKVSSAQTDARAAATSDSGMGLRRVHWMLPADRRVHDAAIDCVLAEAFAAESSSMFVETLEVRYATTAIAIRLPVDDRGTKSADAPISSLLGPEDEKPLSGELVGFASTELEIGVLVGRLSACRFATGVRLADARETQFNDRKMREFRIAFEIRQDVARPSRP